MKTFKLVTIIGICLLAFYCCKKEKSNDPIQENPPQQSIATISILTNSNTESNGTHLNTNTKASLEARNSREFDNINSDPIIPYSEEAILSKKINELIAMQTEENKEEIEMNLEDLIYKYSTNEQREQYDRDLDQIDNQIYSIN